MERKLPLEGIRIADFSWFGAGPIATKYMADHGAEVVKVESEAKLDGLRYAQPIPDGKPGPNSSGYYNNFNSSKLGITLNMDHPKGRELARRLVAVCDVVIENYTPRVAEKWGLTYKELVKVKPDIIVVNQPMQGLTGPHRDYRGFGAAIQALSGINSLTGYPECPPVGTGTNYPDFSCNPCHTAIAIMAALRYRRRTGRGQHIEVSQFESTVSVLESAILDYTVNGRVQERHGNRHPAAAPHGAYRCLGEDRWCAIVVVTEEEWRAFCRATGEPAWTKEQRFSSSAQRLANQDELDLLVESWTCQLPPEEVMCILQAAGVAAGVVQDAEDTVTRDPQLRERGHYWRLEQAD
ncbi:MAG TPA: CoA transferase, partial [Dehalococcoidia bacterium]|nr:CoA transferase [Dehalococcoidia bacterium]